MVFNTQNCWEFMNCGREPGGDKVNELGVCPASTFRLTDGYLGGKYGGKACAYIFGDFCSESMSGSVRDRKKACAACDFYNELRYRHRQDFSLESLLNYVEEKNKKGEFSIIIKDGLVDYKK